MTGIGHRTTNVQNLRRAIDSAERQVLDPLNLTLAGFELLDVLSRDPGITVPWAAARMNVSKQSAGVVLLRLSEAGLIRRDFEAMTDRSAPIRLTAAGRERLEAARTAAASIDAVFTAGYTRAQRDDLDRLLGIGLAAFPNARLARMRTTVRTRIAA